MSFEGMQVRKESLRDRTSRVGHDRLDRIIWHNERRKTDSREGF